MKTGDKNAMLSGTDPSDLIVPGQQGLTLSFLNALTEGVIVHDANGEIIICNKAAEAITGLKKEQMMDRDFLETHWKAFHEDRSPFDWDTFPVIMALKIRQPQKNIVLGINRHDNTVWLNFNCRPVVDPETKEVLLTVTSFSDITSVRLAEEEIRRSEKKWRSVLDSSNSGIYLIDTDYNIVLINEYGKKMFRMMGDFSDTDQPTSFFDKIPPSRKGPVKQILDNALQGLRTEYEILYTKEDGNDLWLLVNYTPVKDADGKISSICIVANNITTLKRKEAALVKSEQRWKFALDGAGDGVWEYNFQTKESYYSPLYKMMLGFSEEEFKNEAYEWRTRVHPEDLERINDIDKQYEEAERQNHAVEYRLRNKAGNYVWVLDRGMLLERTPDGKPLKIVGTHKNVTERKLAEETLMQSQMQFSSFMSNTPTMCWIIDEKAVFRYLNEPYMKAFNLTQNAVGKSVYDIFPKHVCDNFVENNWKVWEKGTAIETIEEGVGPNGAQQFYQIFKFPLEPEMGLRMLGGVALDITKKIQIEQQLAAEDEEKKREIIQAIIDAQERERKELAYELHDNVNQILTSSKLMLEVAAEKPELSADFVGRSLNYLNEAIVEIRKISHSLTPGTLRDISLEAAIDEVVQTIITSGKLRINYIRNTIDAKKEIQAEIQLSVLRIAQEQLNNILKHAAATEAILSLDIGADRLSMTISDNGKGFDPPTTRKGLGLNNIINRVEYYHGLIKLDSSFGNGCSLHIEIPLT